MTVDLEAIARRSDSELSSLKLALPLIEQGFAPPFLARYRRDELGGVGEGALWMLMRSIRSEQALGVRREELTKVWQRTRLADSSLEKAIRDAKSKSAISRVARRLKNEPSDAAATIPPEVWVASRILNPEPGDSGEIAALTAAVGQSDHLDKITEVLDRALARRLAEHPQIQSTAVRWLTANASIRFLEVSDPNIESRHESESHEAAAASPQRPETEPGAHWPSPEELTASSGPSPGPDAASQGSAPQAADADQQPAARDAGSSNSQGSQQPEEKPADQPPADQPDTAPSTLSPAAETVTDAADPGAAAGAANHGVSLPPAEPNDGTAAKSTLEMESTSPAVPAGDLGASPQDASPQDASPQDASPQDASPQDASPQDASPQDGETAAESSEAVAAPPREPAGKKQAGKKGKAAKPIVKQTKVFKKLSPRQRRRRWLIGILQPLVGKLISIRSLSPFQTLVLSRALRANLVRCQFVYDANQLIAQLGKTAANLNPALSERLSRIVTEHEASIREITESVWWDELQDVATNRLVDLTAAHLDAHLHRGAIEAKTVLAIDAVGPRTSPVSIISNDGRLLHTEDIASQLDTELRTASVTRLGELIHRFGVDLIVISNGPARRAAMIILGELIAQSPENSIRWTIAERSGADAYASSELADREMRVTPRRFRAAAWLAFSLLKPAWALAKVDPLKLRLSAAQRELPEELLAPALHDVMTSAVSRGGLDVNSAAVDSLAQLPGVTREVAVAIDRERRKSLFTSREQLLALEEWPDEMHGRQAIGFLRVFGGDEPLDATVIHPEDYSLARKLAKALNLELPPAAPPGYHPPTFDDPKSQPPAPAGEASDTAAASDASSTNAGQDAASDHEEHLPFATELMGASPASAEPSARPVGEDQPGQADAAAAPSPETLAVELQSPEPQSADAPAAATPIETMPQPSSPNGDAEAVCEAAEPLSDVGEPTSEAAASGEEGPASTNASQADAPAPSSGRQTLPDPAAINKCIREWQVGSSRAHRLVHALCDPFGEEALATVGTAPAVMTRLPKTTDLRPGDQMVGVVASVASFGAFVEVSPELTGLVRVSRLAEQFVEEIHDFIQVGDVVTAWVTEIDSRRRLQLSALSPQREQELRRQRQEQREHRNHRRGGQGRGDRGGHGGQAQGGQARSGQTGGQAGGQAGGQGRREASQVPAGQPHRAGSQAGSQAGGQGGARTAARGEPRRGGGRDDARRGGEGRGRERGNRRDEPTSYTTRVAKNQPPAEPITEAMAEGKEPLRSFGDLLQFFKKDAPPAPPQNKPPAEGKTPPPENTTPADKAADPLKASAQEQVPPPAANAQEPASMGDSQPPPLDDTARQHAADANEFRPEPTAANDKPA